MKKAAGLIIVLLFCIPLILKADALAREKQKDKDKPFVAGYVVVKFRSDVSEPDRERARRIVSGRKGRRLKRTGIEKIQLPPGWDEEKAVEMLSRDPSVQSVRVDPRVELLGVPVLLGMMSTVVPNDALLGQQWYLDALPFRGSFANAGTVYVDVDIDAPEAWAVMSKMFDSAKTAVVGVIDSGCGENGFFDTDTGYDPGHIDLPNSVLFANTSELPADGIDSADVNLMKDDANGWDFVEVDNTPADTDTSLSPYHGTLISGIVGAGWDNGPGVAGIGKGQLKVLPLRFIASFFDVIAAVEYAMDLVEGGHAVRILNMSFKSQNGIDPNGLVEAVEMAQGYGIAVVAAAGNDNGNNNDDFLNRVWPAEYTRDPAISNVLAVAATDDSGFLAGFSNIGPNSVQIAAPGVNIYSTYKGTGQYAFADGTSFSTPIAASVLGLVMAAHPNPSLSPADAIDRVVKGGDFDARLAGLIQSGKRVNLAGALAPFYPYSGLAYLDSTVTISMYDDSISSTYGTVLGAGIDMSWSTTPAAADMIPAGARTLTLAPAVPGIAQFTLYFEGISAPVSTYDTGPWRVTAIKPFTAQVNVGDSVTFQSLLPAVAASVSWSVLDTSVASITTAVDGTGVLDGVQEGITRVILSIDGVQRDYSGWIMVQSTSVFSGGSGGGGGGCGTTSLQPGEAMWPVLLVLGGMILLLVRRRFNFKCQNSNFK